MSCDGETERIAGTSPILRERKVRKGTQSCWECKRRKTRCIFSSPRERACVGCKSRQTRCLSQQFHNEMPATRGKTGIVGRMRSSNDQSVQSSSSQDESIRRGRQNPSSKPTNPVTGRYYDTTFPLVAAWPNEYDLEKFLNIPVQYGKFLRGPFYTPYSGSTCPDALSPRDILRLPPLGSHPVVFARRFLLLGLFIQQLSPHSLRGIASASLNHSEIASRLLETAVAFVTSNDELVQCIEGIECLMLESMYHNNAGHLRRALLSLRRAMTIAQIMGLHRQAHSLLVTLESETLARIDAKNVWFHLVETDRYLSLMLGLPQVAPESDFMGQDVLELYTPEQKMERMLCVAGGRILERNETNMQDLTVTQEIDRLLRCTSACMPPQWWLVPSLSRSSNDASTETECLMLQFTYYFLLTQLHLPYLLHPSDEHQYAYSKMTAVSASRDILTRFVAFRYWRPIAFYCRGVDFIVLIASTVLCLAHIVASRRQQMPLDDTISGKVFDYLVHQRLPDRGLIERTLTHMEKTAHSNEDAIASNIVNILQPLLAFEDSAKSRASFSTVFAAGGIEESLEYSGKLSDCGNTLSISIPHCGKISVERLLSGYDPLLPLEPHNVSPASEEIFDEVTPVNGDIVAQDVQQSAPWFTVDQGADIAFFDNLLDFE